MIIINRKYIGRTLIILGTLLLVALLILNGIIYFKNKIAIAEFKESIGNTSNYNISNIEPGDCIGVLEISKIDLSLAINEGTDSPNLKYTLGHFIDTPMPWQDGNFSVAGHRGYARGQLLNRLNEVSSGDKIKVTTQSATFEYEVSNVDIVSPEDTHVLNSGNEKTITIITCTPIYSGTHRLVIKGKLISEY